MRDIRQNLRDRLALLDGRRAEARASYDEAVEALEQEEAELLTTIKVLDRLEGSEPITVAKKPLPNPPGPLAQAQLKKIAEKRAPAGPPVLSKDGAVLVDMGRGVVVFRNKEVALAERSARMVGALARAMPGFLLIPDIISRTWAHPPPTAEIELKGSIETANACLSMIRLQIKEAVKGGYVLAPLD